jgi:dethiobiotin synthetase
MNKPIIFVTATNTDIGKTYAMKQLIKTLSDQGKRVGIIKPIETGVEDIPVDAHELFEYAKSFNEDLESLSLEDVCPYQFKLPAAPYVAKEHEDIEIDIIKIALEKIQNYCDIILMEGAGGVLVPICEGFFMIDLIEIFADSVLLVVPSRLGSINDTLLNIEVLGQKKLQLTWAVNLYEDKSSFSKITEPFYKDYFRSFYTLQNDMEAIAKELSKPAIPEELF